tara:strand:- start:608 stop:943 length:336 start_codon:yes stop_codon:yes gene_type:complete
MSYDYKREIIFYLRKQKWNSLELEELVESWEGPVVPLIDAALDGRISLMRFFNPELDNEYYKTAADIVCPIPDSPLKPTYVSEIYISNLMKKQKKEEEAKKKNTKRSRPSL